MGRIRRVMEKGFLFFGLLFLMSIPLAMMEMVPELAMFALVGFAIASGIGIVMTTPEGN